MSTELPNPRLTREEGELLCEAAELTAKPPYSSDRFHALAIKLRRALSAPEEDEQ